MPRPLMQHGVRQLEELFAESKSDQRVLKQLEHELQYRQVPRAVALLAEVQAAMDGTAPFPASSAEAPSPQPSRWDVPGLPTVQSTTSGVPPIATPVAARPVVAPDTGEPASPKAAAMPLEDAYKLLKATPSATWESIEQTRRLLVQASHPEKLRNQPASKRAQTLAEAGRINAAYAVLSQVQCSGSAGQQH